MLPGIAQLEATPAILRALFESLDAEDVNWKPSPERWSIAEVVEHLSHVEAHGFRARVDQMLAEPTPLLKTYDQEALARDGHYSGRDIEDSFDHWEDQRETNLEFLRNLQPAVLARDGQHEQFGRITLGELLNEWAFHDLGHVRQIAELLRARRYYPHMGPFQSVYQVHP